MDGYYRWSELIDKHKPQAKSSVQEQLKRIAETYPASNAQDYVVSLDVLDVGNLYRLWEKLPQDQRPKIVKKLSAILEQPLDDDLRQVRELLEHR